MFISPKVVYETIYLESSAEDVYKMLGIKIAYDLDTDTKAIETAFKSKVLEPFVHFLSTGTPKFAIDALEQIGDKALRNILHNQKLETPWNRTPRLKMNFDEFLSFVNGNKGKTRKELLTSISKKVKKPIKEVETMMKGTYITIKKMTETHNNIIQHELAEMFSARSTIVSNISYGLMHGYHNLSSYISGFTNSTTENFQKELKLNTKTLFKMNTEAKNTLKTGKFLSNIGGKAKTFFKSAGAPLLIGVPILLGGVAAIHKLVGKKAPIPWYREQFNAIALGLGGIAVVAILANFIIKKSKTSKKFENDISSLMLETFNSVNAPLLEGSLSSNFLSAIKSVFFYPFKLIAKVVKSIYTKFKNKTKFGFLDIIILIILFALTISVADMLIITLIKLSKTLLT